MMNSIQCKQNINKMIKETIRLLPKLINKETLLSEKDESSSDGSPPQNEEQKDIQKEPRRKQMLQEEENNIKEQLKEVMPAYITKAKEAGDMLQKLMG